MKRHQNGNVLFLILIAVALFAALSYAVTQSSRSGGDGISKDKARLAAGQIVQYGGAVEQAISRMRLINRCGETDISFHIAGNADFTNYEHTPASETRCKVFHPDGGAMQPLIPDAEWLDPAHGSDAYYGHVYYASTKLGASGGGQAGTTALDLVMLLPYIREEICTAINAKLDAPMFSEDNAISPNPWFAGDYTQAGGADINNPAVSGRLYAGCFRGHAPFVVGAYVYYTAIIQR